MAFFLQYETGSKKKIQYFHIPSRQSNNQPTRVYMYSGAQWLLSGWRLLCYHLLPGFFIYHPAYQITLYTHIHTYTHSRFHLLSYATSFTGMCGCNPNCMQMQFLCVCACCRVVLCACLGVRQCIGKKTWALVFLVYIGWGTLWCRLLLFKTLYANLFIHTVWIMQNLPQTHTLSDMHTDED